jgi:hypothetical protein
VDIRRRHGTKGGSLCSRLLLIEDVEWPLEGVTFRADS